METDVLIVGVGAAGLMAARELATAGKKVTILEARDRIGGRIYPLSEKDFGYSAQGGAEFMHGDAPISHALLTEAGLTFTHPIEWWSVLDGEPRVNETISPHDPILEAKLLELTEDMTVAEFFDRFFNDTKYDALRKLIYRRLEGYSAADPSKSSAFALRDELTDEHAWKQNNLKESYSKLLSFFEAEAAQLGIDILLSKVVTDIHVSGNEAYIKTADGPVYTAKKVIVTVPLPIIKTLHITPPIPDKIKAAASMGYGSVLKILLRFKTKWWAGALEQNFERMFYMFSYEAIPTWWTQYPETYITLTGWLAGPKAEALADTSDAELQKIALSSLSNIFKVSIEQLEGELVAAKFVNWSKDPYARGAYSYSTPESDAARIELNKPVEDTLYFAGEAISQTAESGTVEAALSSGLETAHKILGQ